MGISENNDLAISAELTETPIIQELLDVIQTEDELRNAVLEMGGYDIKAMDEVIGQVED